MANTWDGTTATPVQDAPDFICEFSTPSTTTTLAISATTARTTVAGQGKMRIYSSIDAFVKLGNSAVTSTVTDSMPITAKIPEIIATGGATHISCIAGGAGTLYITAL